MMADYYENWWWHRFIESYSENPELMKSSPAYTLLVSPPMCIDLITKAVATAMMGPSKDVRMYAAIFLQDLTRTDIIDDAYLIGIPFLTLDSLRLNALEMMVANERGTDEQEAGFLLTVVLVRLSLHHDDVHGWPELQELMDMAFTENPHILDLLIDVVCELPDRHVPRFVRFLKPGILRNFDPFLNAMRDMFAQGLDHGAFYLLPHLYTVLSETLWKRMLRAAIATPFFHNEPRPYIRVFAAYSLLKSVERTEYSFPSLWITPMNDIITVLLNTENRNRPRDARETILGVRLRSALLTKEYD